MVKKMVVQILELDGQRATVTDYETRAKER